MNKRKTKLCFKQTADGQTNGIEIIHKGNDVWVDALGRVVS